MERKTTEHLYYILDENRNAIECDDLTEWSISFSKPRHVKQQNIGPWHISTVFLGIDHNFNMEGKPILFETMIFGPWPFGGIQERCDCWEAAEIQHDRLASKIKKHTNTYATYCIVVCTALFVLLGVYC